MLDFNMFGENLLQEREKAKISQAELAERVGLSTTSISKIECGNNTKLENAIKIANALGVSLDYLCGDHEAERLQPPKIKLETLADLQLLFDLFCEKLDFCEIHLSNDDDSPWDEKGNYIADDIYLVFRNCPKIVKYYKDYKLLSHRLMPDRVIDFWKISAINDLENTPMKDHDLPI